MTLTTLRVPIERVTLTLSGPDLDAPLVFIVPAGREAEYADTLPWLYSAPGFSVSITRATESDSPAGEGEAV